MKNSITRAHTLNDYFYTHKRNIHAVPYTVRCTHGYINSTDSRTTDHHCVASRRTDDPIIAKRSNKSRVIHIQFQCKAQSQSYT